MAAVPDINPHPHYDAGCYTKACECISQAIWGWFDEPVPPPWKMENKKVPSTQQPLPQHVIQHHVHPGEQMYTHQHPQLTSNLSSPQSSQYQQNGMMQQLLQSQYQSNIDARSPLLENRQELAYGTTYGYDFKSYPATNENYNMYPQSPPRPERTDLQTDQNVNHELLQNIPKGYNAEVYQDYLRRNPPKDTNQIYQNHQPMYRPNIPISPNQQPNQQTNQQGSKPYLPYSNRVGPQSNTELLRRQYNEIQQLKMQQQMHYQSQAQMQQQQKFAERQLLLQQIHGVQPPPNLQNSIYSDGSFRDIYSSKSEFRDFNKEDIQKEVDRYAKNNEFKEIDKQQTQYPQEPQWQSNHHIDFERFKQYEGEKLKNQSQSTEYNNQKNNVGIVSPMKSSESNSPSIRSPSSESRKSSSGSQTIRSPIAQRSPSAPVTTCGILYKQGSDGLKVWRKRWFVLSEYCLFYYKSQEEEKLLGSVLLPSYKVSACTAEDKVLRKFAFKLEHANMRTYVLAAPDQESMMKWVKALTMAALMQNQLDQLRKQSERTAGKVEDNDDVPGPTYANAPPKPRRSNEGYNSPSPDMYDPNYDLLKKPASHYSLGTGHIHTNSQVNQESTYSQNPQLPSQQLFQKRPYDPHNMSLPLTNSMPDRTDLNQPGPSGYKSKQSSYFDNRSRPQEQIYDRQPKRTSNPFIQDATPDINKEKESQNQNYRAMEPERSKHSQIDDRIGSNVDNSFNRDVYGDAMGNKPNKHLIAPNDRLATDRRTPDAYSRAVAMTNYNKGNLCDYEDVYGQYDEYGRPYSKTTSPPQLVKDSVANQIATDYSSNYVPQEKTFNGPSVLRRKKQQASGIQPQVPRPHSADFLEYESKNAMLNKTMPSRTAYEPPKQPQRPKSSLDINSFYDPSSDRYYSEESYAQKMRQSAQYLQGIAPKNIQIPLAKYASGLAEKQLESAYSQNVNNNYETEFSSGRNSRANVTPITNSRDREGFNSNWTLKGKGPDSQSLGYMKRSGSAMSNGSNISGVKEQRLDTSAEGFSRSLSARLSSYDKDGDGKVQQREESMKRLLEWKQRMLQSPLTRKTTPNGIFLDPVKKSSRDPYGTKRDAKYNSSYNSFSSDDEESTSGTDLQKPRPMQAGRSQNENLKCPILTEPLPSHTLPKISTSNIEKETESDQLDTSNTSSDKNTYVNIEALANALNESIKKESTYENTKLPIEAPVVHIDQEKEVEDEKDEDGYETHESEAESENQMEYTDNDLDEVLLDAPKPTEVSKYIKPIIDAENNEKDRENVEEVSTSEDKKPETPPLCTGEDHYLPMSPRKTSVVIEPAHKTIIEHLNVFEHTTLPMGHEEMTYVEMNLGNEEEDMQTYEIVCVNNGTVEPVYMELCHLTSASEILQEGTSQDGPKSLVDTASNFADTKEHTLKRASKGEKNQESKTFRSDSDADDESGKDLESSLKRFSISDTFRPASYYLGHSDKITDINESSDSDAQSLHRSNSSSEKITDEALSRYILDKLDQCNISQDNSILKMLSNENQKMNTAKRKTTSLMIYGSKTSIHDTLSRGEKVRNTRANLTERHRLNEAQNNLSPCSNLDHYNSNRSIETDSLMSYNADKGSSRLSIESDVSSKFEINRSNNSSDVASLNESDSNIELRQSSAYRDVEELLKRRPLSDDSLFESVNFSPRLSEPINKIDLDRFLDNLQPCHSKTETVRSNLGVNSSTLTNRRQSKDNVARAAHLNTISHVRCSSMPVQQTSTSQEIKSTLIYPNISDQHSGYTGSQSSCSSVGVTKSPLAYYTKTFDEETLLTKNLNKELDKFKDFEVEKMVIKPEVETITLSNTTSFHSRESSTEQSAPYYYSDLSSQEHINVLPTSHYLKNTNLHRKLNNQRRRGPMYKKNEISHIHNPLHNEDFSPNQSFELAAARSVSVEFLSAAEKDPEIDLKNIYESTKGKKSKIPESMNIISSFGCKSNSNLNYDCSSPDSSTKLVDYPQKCSPMKASNTSMSSPCSENSSNTVYYDAEADAIAYENLMYQADNMWDEDALWRDNLRRASHRHARSMDDLDTLPTDTHLVSRNSIDPNMLNSIKRVKKEKKITRNVTYVNSSIHEQLLKQRENSISENEGVEKPDDNDVYVSLVEQAEILMEQSDEGVYEQLAVSSSDNSLVSTGQVRNREKSKFQIDREKLRQWDLMSSGLCKGGRVIVRGKGAGPVGEVLCSTDSGADSATNEASMTITGANVEQTGANSNQHLLSKKAYLGSNTSLGRNNRDANIPVRAVSPRVRWVEAKTIGDHYGTQQMSASQQNLATTEDIWTTVRSPSRASQQPIRAVSPRVRRNTENNDLAKDYQRLKDQLPDIPSAGELLGRTHEELVLLLIQLRRRHAATHRAIEQCCSQISSIEDCLTSLKALEREESLQRLEQLKMQLMELEHQYEKSKPLVQLVDNMVKLGSFYNKPGSTMERLERNQSLRHKVLTEHAMEQQRWLESAAAGKPLETEAARARVAELWALEQELADEAAILQGLKTDKDTIETLLSGVRGRFSNMQVNETTHSEDLEAELARVHAMLALNSKKLEQTVADNARLERELLQLRRALHTQRVSPAPAHTHTHTAMLEDEVSRVQQLVSALQRQRQELSRAVRHLTQQSQALQTTHNLLPSSKRRTPNHQQWQETNLDSSLVDHNQSEYSDYDVMSPGHYDTSVEMPLFVDTRGDEDLSPMTSEEQGGFGNLSNVEKQEIKTVRIVKRESERRQRDRERSLQPMSDWPTTISNMEQYLEEDIQPQNYQRSQSVPRTDFSKFEEYYSKPQDPPNYLKINTNMEVSPKYPSSPSLSNYDYSKDISSLTSSYNKSYDRSGYDRTVSISTQYLNSPTDSSKTLTNNMSKTSSIGSLTRSHMELSPIFKSEAAKQIITEMAGEPVKNGSLHRRQVPKEKRRHYTAPHHLSAKTLNEMPKELFNQDKVGRSLDDADMERALRAPPDVVRSALAPQKFAENTIDQLLLAPQKILIPERYIPEKPIELSPEEQQKRKEKVESIKKMLSSSSADPNKSPDTEEKKQKEHLLQMNQILAKQVTEMSKIIAEKAIQELPLRTNLNDYDDYSPDTELPIYQQRDNFFS